MCVRQTENNEILRTLRAGTNVRGVIKCESRIVVCRAGNTKVIGILGEQCTHTFINNKQTNRKSIQCSMKLRIVCLHNARLPCMCILCECTHRDWACMRCLRVPFKSSRPLHMKSVTRDAEYCKQKN